jgi:hypothetical protein
MTLARIGAVLLAGVVLAAGTVMLAARGQSRPGEMTQSHVWIDNRSPDDAIPVVVQRGTDPVRVQVAGTHIVTIDPASPVAARAVRQPWEYRTIAVSPGQDVAGAVARAGAEGWEAVGFQGGQGGVTVLLKRPL